MSNLVCFIGDTTKIDVQVFTNASNTTPLNLTGQSVVFEAKDNWASPSLTITKTVGAGVVVTNAALGRCLVTLAPSDTSALPPISLTYVLRVLDGSDVYTVASGRLQVKRIV